MFGRLGWHPVVQCMPLRGRDLYERVREANNTSKREGRGGFNVHSEEAGRFLREAGWRKLKQPATGVSGVSKVGAQGSLGAK